MNVFLIIWKGHSNSPAILFQSSPRRTQPQAQQLAKFPLYGNNDGTGSANLDTVIACSPILTTRVSQIRNVVFIGETGSGKSSVINLIAGYDYAAVSPDAAPCTADFASYQVSIEGRTYRMWDTPGLNEPSGFRLFRRSSPTKESIKRFLQERRRREELDLLVLCVRGSRAHEGMSRAYKIFCRATRQLTTPVVIALTHLEREQPTMETWWQKNERMLENLGLVFDGHVCITCQSSHNRRWASQQEIRGLISREYQRRPRSIMSDQKYLDDPKGCVVC